MKYVPRIVLFLAIPALLFLVPWWTLIGATTDGALRWLGSAVFLAGFVCLPAAMFLGHGPRQHDAASIVGDTLLDDDAVGAALRDTGPRLRGRVLVNLTSSAPEQSRRRAEWAGRHGAEYVDGAVMAVPQGIGTPDALLLYSGSESGYRAAEPALSTLAEKGTYLGADHGRAAAFDASLVSVFWLSYFGVAMGIALAEAEGIKGSELVPFTPAVVSLLPDMAAQTAAQVEAGHYPGDDTSISSAFTAFTTLREVIARHGIDTGVLDATGQVFRRALEAGHGAEGLARLVPVLAGER